MLAYQLSSFLLYVYMPNCYICLLQIVSLVSVCMSAILCKVLSRHDICQFYMPTASCFVKFYVFAYPNLYICNSARFSMPVEMLSILYLLICQMLWVPSCIETTVDFCYDKFSICFDHMLYVICRLSYAKARMPVYICWMPCASCCKFILKSAYMPISVPVSA
jgi:hypothetical protein